MQDTFNKKQLSKYKKVVIGKDRTPQQREEWKEARKKRPTPRSDTERRDSEDRRHESEMDTNVQQLDRITNTDDKNKYIPPWTGFAYFGDTKQST